MTFQALTRRVTGRKLKHVVTVIPFRGPLGACSALSVLWLRAV